MRDWLSLSLFSSTLLPTTPSPTPTPLSFSFSSSHKHYTLAPWWSGITGGWMWRSWSDVSALSRRLTWSCLPLLGPFFFIFFTRHRDRHSDHQDGEAGGNSCVSYANVSGMLTEDAPADTQTHTDQALTVYEELSWSGEWPVAGSGSWEQCEQCEQPCVTNPSRAIFLSRGCPWQPRCTIYSHTHTQNGLANQTQARFLSPQTSIDWNSCRHIESYFWSQTDSTFRPLQGDKRQHFQKETKKAASESHCVIVLCLKSAEERLLTSPVAFLMSESV